MNDCVRMPNTESLLTYSENVCLLYRKWLKIISNMYYHCIINVQNGVNYMTQVSITEFRNNIKKYSELVKKGDIEVISRGKVVFVVKSPSARKKEAAASIIGCVPSDADYEDILKMRMTEL